MTRSIVGLVKAVVGIDVLDFRPCCTSARIDGNASSSFAIDSRYWAIKLRETPDGDGTLLDPAILLQGAGMGDGHQHTPYNLPITLMGGGCGQLAGNRHLVYEMHTAFMNLGLTLIEKVGVKVDSISDSTGPLTGV